MCAMRISSEFSNGVFSKQQDFERLNLEGNLVFIHQHKSKLHSPWMDVVVS